MSTLPTLQPSASCVSVGGGLRIIGHHLIPGEHISGWIDNGKYEDPMWRFTADENGDLDQNITVRWNIGHYGPPACQPYYFNAWQSGVYARFSVWYETDDQHTNNARSVLAIDTSMLSSSNLVRITAQIEPYNNYQVQATTNFVDWKFMGDIWYSDANYCDPSEATNRTTVIKVDPGQPQMFFRIADPIGPCPCMFGTNSS